MIIGTVIRKNVFHGGTPRLTDASSALLPVCASMAADERTEPSTDQCPGEVGDESTAADDAAPTDPLAAPEAPEHHADPTA